MAQGEDEIRILYTFTALDASSYQSTGYRSRFRASWAQIFSRISPLMIDEAEDEELKAELNRMILEVNIASLRHADYLEGLQLQFFAIGSDDFNTIKVQGVVRGRLWGASELGLSRSSQK